MKNKRRQPASAREKIERVEAFLDGLDDEKADTPEARKALFEARGWSVQRTLDAVHDEMARARAKERLESARAERASLLERVYARLPKADSGLVQQVWEGLQILAGRQPQTAGVYFRRFEQATPEDLQSLLEDLRMLEQIEADDA